MMRTRMFRHIATPGCAVAAAVLLIATTAMQPVTARQSEGRSNLETIQLRPNFYMIAGAGGNVAVQIGPIGVVLVDTGSSRAADDVLAAVRRLTTQPIRYIISTSADADHVGGNGTLSKAGVTILGPPRGNSLSEEVVNNGGAASVLAHEAVLARMSDAPPQPTLLWPTKVYTGRMYAMTLNGEGIQIFHQPAAHSDGDSVVLFRSANVVVAGDIVNVEHFPVIDVAAGGSIDGEIEALNHLLELVIPPFPLTWQEGRTHVIPGHGRLLDFADIVEYRNMTVVVRSIIADMMRRGMTLEQVKAADPTKAYRGRYGVESGSWTTDMFVEAVFASLTKDS